jgi:hypothetical protein
MFDRHEDWRIGSERCGTVGHVNERDTPAQRAGQARGEIDSSVWQLS